MFATGVNGKPGLRTEDNPMLRMLGRLIPTFRPPRLRRALIFEMELESGKPSWLDQELYFVEYGSKSLPLEMCSLVPKGGFLTAVLVGKSVDAAPDAAALRDIMKRFLELPHIQKLVPPRTQLRLACTCSPNMVVRSARNPFADRVAAVGDLVTSRLYKDGI